MASNEKPGDLSTAALGLLVELLAAREQANTLRDELTPWVRKAVDPFGVWSDLASGVTKAEVRNLAFEVARIQVQSLAELTRQGESLSRKIVQRLKDAKQPAPARPGEEQLLVCNLAETAREPYHGEFVAPANVDRLPQALVLRPLEGGAEFPVRATFGVVRAGDRATVSVSVDPDPWIQSGKHYQARLPLPGTDVVVWFKLVGR